MLNLRTGRKGKISTVRKLADLIARRKTVNSPNISCTRSARFPLYFEFYSIRPKSNTIEWFHDPSGRGLFYAISNGSPAKMGAWLKCVRTLLCIFLNFYFDFPKMCFLKNILKVILLRFSVITN